MNRKKALAVLMAAAMTSSIFGAVPAMASEDKPFEGQEITFADPQCPSYFFRDYDSSKIIYPPDYPCGFHGTFPP